MFTAYRRNVQWRMRKNKSNIDKRSIFSLHNHTINGAHRNDEIVLHWHHLTNINELWMFWKWHHSFVNMKIETVISQIIFLKLNFARFLPFGFLIFPHHSSDAVSKIWTLFCWNSSGEVKRNEGIVWRLMRFLLLFSPFIFKSTISNLMEIEYDIAL